MCECLQCDPQAPTSEPFAIGGAKAKTWRRPLLDDGWKSRQIDYVIQRAIPRYELQADLERHGLVQVDKTTYRERCEELLDTLEEVRVAARGGADANWGCLNFSCISAASCCGYTHCSTGVHCAVTSATTKS